MLINVGDVYYSDIRVRTEISGPTGTSEMEGYPDLYELRKLQRDNLQLCLQTFTGPLELVLDRTVIPSLDRIAGMKFLTENGVQRVHKLDASQIEIKSDIDKD